MTAIIAVDGPSGSGKSSVSRGVAQHFGFQYLDTGAMYRATTWFVMDRAVDPSDPLAVVTLLSDLTISSGTDPTDPSIWVNGVDVSVPIRGDDVTNAVSLVSAIPEVRRAMRDLQRQVAADASRADTGIVVEGRDIGSEVLPDADVKIYLTADPAVRAARRAAQDAASVHGTVGVAATEESLRRRDELDTTRASSPLRMAADAHLVDATDLDLDDTIGAVCAIVSQSLGWTA
jgi:cytidylate kinase